MRLDPKKLMVGRDLHVGYHRHQEKDGRSTFSVEVCEVQSGYLVYFEAVRSQASAIARASALADCFSVCEYIGQFKEDENAVP